MSRSTRLRIASILRAVASTIQGSEATDVLFQMQKELNPKLWDADKHLKPEVRSALLKLAQDFIDGFAYPLEVTDIILTGSSANYNWNKYSDLDVHVIANFDDVPEEYVPAFSEYADAKRKLWNNEHDVVVFDHEVEMYVQDQNEDLEAKGVYSLQDDKWLVQPNPAEVNADKATVEKKVDRFHVLIEHLESMMDQGDFDVCYKASEILKQKIKKYRTAGLEKDGELGTENLVFKTLRNDGTLQKLDDLHRESYDKMMGLSDGKKVRAGLGIQAAPKREWLDDMEMPGQGCITREFVEQFVRSRISDIVYDEHDADDIDSDDVEIPQQALQEVLRQSEQFNKNAFKTLCDYMVVAKRVPPLSEVPEEEKEDIEWVNESMEEAVSACWNNNGASNFWLACTGASSLNDVWGSRPSSWYGPRGNGLGDKYDFDVNDLDRYVTKRLTQQAHALESAMNSLAQLAVDKHTETAPLPRGPDHDTIVYRFAGNNQSIAGASAKGMYVAELSLEHLKDESNELGHCIGNKKHGHPQLKEDGTTSVFSIRTESGRSKFTIEQFIEDGEHPQQGNLKAGTVSEVKGKGNRLPGFDPGSSELTKPDEVKLVTDFLINYLHMTPAQIESSPDIRGGVRAMKAMGLDPYSPPPPKAARPKRDPRALQAALRLVKADYLRVPF